MKRIVTLLLLLASCRSYDFTLDNLPCDENNECLAGYVCSINHRCVREGTAAACQPRDEIACNGIDEDCNGIDAVETGTLANCGGCNDTCANGEFVAQSACVAMQCTVTRCDAGHVNADNLASNGCETNCTNVDGDNKCDTDDNCIDKDGDGVGDGTAGNAGCATLANDSNDNDSLVCLDTDSDGCNDCSSGAFSPANDGVDRNMDGQCNVTDVDEDDDGVPYTADSNDNDANVCQDLDGDGCNDCSQRLGAPSVSNDGADFDGDGSCDAGDVDDDDDTVLDPDDSNDGSQTICQDIDGDGCDDCAKFATYQGPNVYDDGSFDVDRDGLCGPSGGTTNALADCDDGIPTCAHDCTEDPVDGDNVVECFENYCRDYSGWGAGVPTQLDVCNVVNSTAELFAALGTPRTGPMPQMPIFILINSDILLGPTGVTAATGQRFIIHQRAGTAISVAFATPKAVFQIDEGSDGNEFFGLTIQPAGGAGGPTGRLSDVFHIESDHNIIARTHINGFQNHGVFIEGSPTTTRKNNVVAYSIFSGGLGSQDVNGITSGNIVLSKVEATRVIGNIFTGSAMDALTIAESNGLRIDHNTFFMHSAANDGVSINFVNAPASTASCARNNLFFRDDTSEPEFRYENDNNTSWTASCSEGNLITSPNTGRCDTNVDNSGPGGADCAGLPANFFASGAFPVAGFVNTSDPDAQGFMCLQSAYIDRAGFNPVPNVTVNGMYTEPGAREAGTPFCPLQR